MHLKALTRDLRTKKIESEMKRKEIFSLQNPEAHLLYILSSGNISGSKSNLGLKIFC